MNSRSKLKKSATLLEDDKPVTTNRGAGLILETPYKPGFVDDTDLESVKMAMDKELSDISNALFITTERTVDTIKRTDLLEIADDRLAARIQEVDFVSKADDAALAERILTMEAEINDNVLASITEERRVRADADEALAERIDHIFSSGNDVNADLYSKIEDETRARTTAIETVTERIATAESDYKKADNDLSTTVNARIATEETTRANADLALTTRIDTLTSTVNNNNTTTTARIAAEEKARADADSAMTTRVNTLESSMNTTDSNLNAMIQSEQTARVQGDAKEASDRTAAINSTSSALTSQINSATSTLNNNIASVRTEATTSINAINGRLNTIESKWAVTTDVNGNIAGIALVNGGATKSTFNVRADTFRFVDASGNASGGFVSQGGVTTFNGHVNATSGTFNGTVNANSGTFNGTVNASSGVFNYGTFNNCTISDTCVINGTLSVDRIVGGIAQLVPASNSSSYDFIIEGTRDRAFVCLQDMVASVYANAASYDYGVRIYMYLDGVVIASQTYGVVGGTGGVSLEFKARPMLNISAGRHTLSMAYSRDGSGGIRWTELSTGTWLAVVK